MKKIATGIAGLDHMTEGGLPVARATLVTGTSGSAKTVLAAQFLACGIRYFGENGVFVTFEETPEDLRSNLASFGWPISEWEAEGRWVFVDASISVDSLQTEVGRYDLDGLLARTEAALRQRGAVRVAIDSLGAVFSQFSDATIIRRELFRLVSSVKAMGATAMMTAERIDEFGAVSRFGVEEFVADNVIMLRNVLDAGHRRRTMEILKMRGTHHRRGEVPFSIRNGIGIDVIPLSSLSLGDHRSSTERMTTGVNALDELCGGGLFRGSIVLVSGATGTGKTLISTEFIRGGVLNGDRCLLFAFEEGRDQLLRNARGWGADFEDYEKQGLLKIVSAYPESGELEDHLLKIKEAVETFKPQRVAIDSLSALERVSSQRSFREFIIGATAFLKHAEVSALFTSTAPTLAGGESATESHISTLTDSIILLRYVEWFGEMRRALTVLKMRGSAPDKGVREYTIGDGGLTIGDRFHNLVGIVTGDVSHVMERGFQEADLRR
jgi:circadian clock protein KaiC